jgi:hypothetical protein
MNLFRPRIALLLACLAAMPHAVAGTGAEIWVRVLTGSEMQGALANIFNVPDPEYVHSKKCFEYGASVGQGFDREATIYYVCRVAIDAKDWGRGRVHSKLLRPLITTDTVSRSTKMLCPYHESFGASRVHLTSQSLSAWDINDIAIYANGANTEFLACIKRLRLQ